MVLALQEGEVKNGIYKHWKEGRLYEVIGSVIDAEVGGERVVYIPYGSNSTINTPQPKTFIRSPSDFMRCILDDKGVLLGRRFSWVKESSEINFTENNS